MTYIFDTNTFSEAHKLYYPLDVVVSYWRWVEQTAHEGHMASIERVRDELTAGDPAGERYPLARWALDMPSSFWLPIGSPGATHLREIAAWANQPERIYSAQAISGFMASTDLFLVAQCMEAGGKLVTREVSDPSSRRRVKIPDVCLAFDVECIDPFTAYRRLGMRF
ncbi:MAG TPA: DUF4411 family protein [Candidatus Nanopelagicales bacterium]|nr:DUF4411 family protein [Candidatus Nanopelagicales bacterium]